MHNVIIIGGGAGGMMAAIFAARTGGNVTLLERNEKLGKKVYITGKGRCNVTNDCTLDEFMREVPRNPRFMYSALSYFGPQHMMELLEDGGCPVVVQRGRRVFPATEKASDVTRTLEKLMRESGVRILYGARVKDICIADNAVTGVEMLDGRVIEGDRVIIATGGLSCPLTGSTGDGYRMAEACGHTVTPRSAVLSAIETVETWPGELMGLSLRNVTLTMKKGKKTLYSELGEMLFTHFGVTGPLVLSASAYLTELAPEDCTLTLDLKPGLSPDQLNQRLLRDLDASGKKQLRTLLMGLFPASLAEEMPGICLIPASTLCCDVTREMRQKLVDMTKALPIPVTGTRPLSEAVVTRGGVSVKEIDPRSMESKLVSGLYVSGELPSAGEPGGRRRHAEPEARPQPRAAGRPASAGF